MSANATLLSEADILAQLVAPETPGLSREAARALLDLHFGPDALRRMNELAAKNREGSLTANEQIQLEKYQRVGNFLNLMQAKARVSLLR